MIITQSNMPLKYRENLGFKSVCWFCSSVGMLFISFKIFPMKLANLLILISVELLEQLSAKIHWGLNLSVVKYLLLHKFFICDEVRSNFPLNHRGI